MERWIESDNKWIRRLAIATLPPYIRARPGDSALCLSILNRVMEDGEMEVRKAAAWTLREISKKDPESTYKFLVKWAETGGRNARWIIRHDMRKLERRQQMRLKILLDEL